MLHGINLYHKIPEHRFLKKLGKVLDRVVQPLTRGGRVRGGGKNVVFPAYRSKMLVKLVIS